MKLTSWLSRLKVPAAKVKTPFLELNFEFKEQDKEAAWALYIELLTRVTTQRLDADAGDPAVALTSLHNVFQITRDILKSAGRDCIEFARLTTFMLNRVIRPFTSKWHPISLKPEFAYVENQKKFREELALVQTDMKTYMAMLADIIGIEDISGYDNDLEAQDAPKPNI